MKRSSIVVFLLVMLMLSIALLAGCGGGSDTGATDDGATVDEGSTTGGETFTLAELAEFDGKGGKPAYVAVDGVVYDVSDSTQWPQGDHSPCDLDAAAGKDLSGVLEQSPARMRALIEAMPVVGTLAP
jgi:predicted heme/steroid binding protein